MLANSIYQRKILFSTNSYPETRNLPIEVRGASLVIKSTIPYIKLILLILFALVLSWNILSGYKYDHDGTISGFLFTGGFVSFTVAIFNDKNADGKILQRMLFYVVKGLLLSGSGISGVLIAIHAQEAVDRNHLFPMILNGLMATAAAVLASKLVEKTYLNFRKEKFSYFTTYITLAIAILLGSSLGFGISHSFSRSVLLISSATCSLLFAMGFYNRYNCSKISSSYRQSIHKLIKP